MIAEASPLDLVLIAGSLAFLVAAVAITAWRIRQPSRGDQVLEEYRLDLEHSARELAGKRRAAELELQAAAALQRDRPPAIPQLIARRRR